MIENVKSPNGNYRVIEKVEVGNFDKKFRTYRCIQEETGRECLLRIAAAAKYNAELHREAYVLKELAKHADMLEKDYGTIKTDPKAFLNYKLGFPELVDSFTFQEQGGRQVNVLAFKNVEKVIDMVPLINITAIDHVRIDLRTSAWIMGKLIKLFAFVYDQGISVDLTTDENILINGEQHYVMFFDWTKASWSEDLQIDPMKVQRREIAQAASAVVVALGGNVKTGFFPIEGNEEGTEKGRKEYIKYLLQLARGNMSVDAITAHKEIYRIIDGTWERAFHPFTALPLDRNTIEEMEE
jgi:hypothetical protein